MGEGLLLPSIIIKIQEPPYQFIRNSYKPEASTSVEIYGSIAYMKGIFQSLLNLSLQDSSASSSATPISPLLIDNSSEKVQIQRLTPMMIPFVTTATVPIERLKLLMQCQNELIKAGRLSHPYKGIVDCFSKTIRNEGIISLWRGNTAAVIGQITLQVTRVPANSYSKSTSNHKKDNEDYLKRFSRDVATISIIIGPAHYLTYPLNYAFTRLATDTIHSNARKGNKWQFNGLIDVFRKTIKTDGIIGTYRGCNIAFVGSFLQEALDLGFKVGIALHLIGLLQLPLTSPHTIAITAFGSMTFSVLVTYLLYTLSRRMLMRSGEAVKYRSSLDACAQIFNTEGFKAIYKGATVPVLKYCAIMVLYLSGY